MAGDDLRQKPQGGSQSGGVVGRRVARKRGWAVRVAGERRDPGRGLDDVVEGRVVAAVEPESGERHADDLVVVLAQRVVGQAELVNRRRLQIHQQRMGLRDQRTELTAAVLRREFQTDTALTAVEAGEVAVTDLPGDVTGGRLDLGDLCPEVGQHHGGVRAGQHGADLEDLDPGERDPGLRAGASDPGSGEVIGRLWPAPRSPRGCGTSRRRARRGCRRWAATARTGRSRPRRQNS